MSLKKIYYLSITSFSDVDLGILHNVTNLAEITYGVVIQNKNANYTIDELRNYCSANKITFEPYVFEYQLKDLRSIKYIYNIIKSIKKSNPDLIYVVTFDHILLSVLSLLLDRNKTIIALHDVEFHSDAAYKQILKLSRSITIQYFKRFQVFSSSQRTLFQRLHPNKSVSLLQLPLKDFGHGIQEKSNKIRFLFFGNILHYKGLDLLIKAINSLLPDKSLPTFELLIAGRCEDWEKNYQPLVGDTKEILQMIRFIKNEEIPQIFINAHYLVLPYRDSTQSGPLKIAFNYNVPVIASDIASFNEEVADGVTGYLFKSSDVDCLKLTLVKALNNHDILYQQMKDNQKVYIESIYSTGTIQRQFEKLLNSIESI